MKRLLAAAMFLLFLFSSSAHKVFPKVPPVPAHAPAKQSQAPREKAVRHYSSRHEEPKVLVMEATAYSASEAEGTADGITAIGTRVRRGVAAVDPSVIPLGTRLWVEGYGYATAEDTGRAIKGMRIDLFMESREEALRFGRKTVGVRILE